jgi:glycine betaine/proline transport system ATP-binding protein
MTIAVDFQNVDIVFGEEQRRSLEMIDRGASRDEILAATGSVLGCAGANLTVETGEICVLMGLSGSGKSTLLRAVNRLNLPARGKVLVRDGERMVDVVSADDKTLRHIRQPQVAMVFQQFALLPWRTVEQNVGLGLELAGVPDAERRERVAAQLKLVGLDQWAKKYGHELSGGMQQRVGLARAFATEAPILLMDEPFSALDPLIRTKLQDELLQLQERLRKTIIFVSHDLEEALKIGTHISIMEGGRIVPPGAPEGSARKPANEYGREFIANVNPLSVLTAWNVMRVRRDLDDAGDGWVWLDRRNTTRFRINGDGLVIDAERNGQPAQWVSCDDIERLPPDAPQVFWAKAGTSLKTVMHAMHESQTAPVALFDEQSRFVGSIGVRDVLSAIIRR